MTLSKSIKGLIAGVSLVAILSAGAAFAYFNLGYNLSAAEAQEIAYKNAGVASTDVTLVQTFREREGLKAAYDIEFNTASGNYNYTIDAGSGSILNRELESNGFDNTKTSSSQNTSTDSSTSSQTSTTETNSSEQAISQDTAKETALKDAGLAESAVSNLLVQNDIDNGKAVIEVDFNDTAAGLDYDYTIDATTGEIIEKSSEPILD